MRWDNGKSAIINLWVSFMPLLWSKQGVYEQAPYKKEEDLEAAIELVQTKKIKPIKLVKGGRVKALQNLRYTTLNRLKKAKMLEDVW